MVVGRKRGRELLEGEEHSAIWKSPPPPPNQCSALKSVSAVHRRGRMVGGERHESRQCREDCREAAEDDAGQKRFRPKLRFKQG